VLDLVVERLALGLTGETQALAQVWQGRIGHSTVILGLPFHSRASDPQATSLS
jgi:hypothetical protein